MTGERDPRVVLTEVVPFGRLSVLTYRLADRVGVTVQVLPLSPEQSLIYDGRTNGWRVWFAARAPVHIVAHELAHVLTPRDTDHGPMWRAKFAALAAELTLVT